MIKKAQTRPDINRLQTDTAYLREFLDDLADNFNALDQTVDSLLQTQINTPPAPVANILWNGEIGHSVNSWFDASYVTTDKAKEAAFWFSHSAPFSAKTFTTIAVADTIQLTAHGLTLGTTVDFITTGTLPTGLSLATTYFVIPIDADTIQIASSLANAYAGTAVAISAGTGTGTHTIQFKLLETDARTSSTNNTLKTNGYGALPAHSTYDPLFAKWNASIGCAEMTGTTSVATPVPSNCIDATTTLARVSIGRAAKKNAYIEIPEDCLMGAGIFDATSGQRSFLRGDLGLTAVVEGSAASTVERRYRIHVTTDRGFSLLSPEVVVANAPADGFFSATDNVSLRWRETAGFLQVDIYEYIPSLAEYRLIFESSSGSSYIHLGGFLSIEAGYPSATGTERQAVYYTRYAELSGLATDGEVWDTINFPIEVPDNYNKVATTGRQWVIFWLTAAMNMYITGVTTDGSADITVPASIFESEYSAIYNSGTLVVEVMDEFETIITTTVASAYSSDTVLTLGASIAAGTNRIVRIVGGGFHGIYIDKIHLGFQTNTSYAPNALDARTLQPVAAPSSSSQGGTGGGGDGGGINCVAFDTPIKTAAGWKPVENCRAGQIWHAPGLTPNILGRLKIGFDFVRLVRAENGVEIECTDSERFVCDNSDSNGTPLKHLRVGDFVLTEVDDRIERVRLTSISPYLGKKRVYTPTLSNNRLFVGGKIAETKGLFSTVKKIWRRITRASARKGGFILHNNKPADI